jgi:Flp pilus assembly pilin Flp
LGEPSRLWAKPAFRTNKTLAARIVQYALLVFVVAAIAVATLQFAGEELAQIFRMIAGKLGLR